MIQWLGVVIAIAIAIYLMVGIWRNKREDTRQHLVRAVKRAAQLSEDLTPTSTVVWYDNETHDAVRKFDVCHNQTRWVDLSETAQSEYHYFCCPSCHITWIIE